jgi:Uma2 family endonuclease
MTIVIPKRFTLEEYNRLAELGFFNESSRVELIRGEIIQMIAKATPHSVCGTRLNLWIFIVFIKALFSSP